MDIAAVVAGSITGYRSYMTATGKPVTHGTAAQALSRDVPHLREQRRID